ncbi:MAG TPA: DNA-formamidopyrimidine glycosylase family protein [Acidimicrobiales bacterium]|nr:DNA-formamidopyrimidine glycosylase family protein [Acidimicrobiales bacterium]
MPEGHVTHRLATEIEQRFARRVVHASSPQGRFVEGAALIDGHKVLGAESVGKHLFVRFPHALFLHVHLGLYGRFTFGDAPVPEPVGEIRLRLVSRTSWADLRGATRCEILDPAGKDDIEARLGDDPLRAESNGERAWKRISASRASIATLLMDQSVVAGSGNIFRAEVLFRSGIDPMREGRSITEDEWAALWGDLVSLMGYAYRHGRVDTVRAAHLPEAMGRAPREDAHGGEVYVYRRAGQACHVCGDTIRRRELGNRNLFWCPTCQSGA